MTRIDTSNFKHGDVLFGRATRSPQTEEYGDGYWIGVVYTNFFSGDLSIFWNWVSGTEAAKGIRTVVKASNFISEHVIIGDVANLLDQKSEGR